MPFHLLPYSYFVALLTHHFPTWKVLTRILPSEKNQRIWFSTCWIRFIQLRTESVICMLVAFILRIWFNCSFYWQDWFRVKYHHIVTKATVGIAPHSLTAWVQGYCKSIILYLVCISWHIYYLCMMVDTPSYKLYNMCLDKGCLKTLHLPTNHNQLISCHEHHNMDNNHTSRLNCMCTEPVIGSPPLVS